MENGWTATFDSVRGEGEGCPRQRGFGLEIGRERYFEILCDQGNRLSIDGNQHKGESDPLNFLTVK